MGNTLKGSERMPHGRQEWQAVLAALPTTTHISFSLHAFPGQYQRYWYAKWREKQTGRRWTLYLGKKAPTEHPCFGGACTHPFRHGQPKPRTGRKGQKLGWSPSPETIEHERQAQLGKRRGGTDRHTSPNTQGKRHPAERIPLYLQVADQLAQEMRAGRYQPGQRLPPVPTLAARYGVPESTAYLACLELRQQHLVVNRPEGFLVREPHASEPQGS